jgi:chromosome condensin MukBEF ATPase and DNA-binding subunit MukB
VATHAAKCAKAEALATRIQAREAKAPTWLAAAQAREAKATSAGHPKVAKFIEHRIARVEKLIPKGEKVLAKIAAKCGSATSTS